MAHLLGSTSPARASSVGFTMDVGLFPLFSPLPASPSNRPLTRHPTNVAFAVLHSPSLPFRWSITTLNRLSDHVITLPFDPSLRTPPRPSLSSTHFQRRPPGHLRQAVTRTPTRTPSPSTLAQHHQHHIKCRSLTLKRVQALSSGRRLSKRARSLGLLRDEACNRVVSCSMRAFVKIHSYP